MKWKGANLERISTGIVELDKLIGGYIKGGSVLITGPAGAGKTIFALQFVNSVCAAGKKAVYISVQEKRLDLIEQASIFGWDLDGYEKQGLLHFVGIFESQMVDDYKFNSYGSEIGFSSIVENIKGEVDAVVVDNLGILTLDMAISNFRQQLDYLIYALSYRGCTSILTFNERLIEKFGEVATYSFDGVIRLFKRDSLYADSRERVLEIIKMKNTRHPINYIIFEITEKGIRLDI
ncbi:MAG: ATPase domain-containing protein [Methanomassiliicoccales archaeon]